MESNLKELADQLHSAWAELLGAQIDQLRIGAGAARRHADWLESRADALESLRGLIREELTDA